ncbi:MAG: hypothetical protein OXQ89_16225 [Rhodospirillaceae bacterium]|nr:hypothetical protein [Rhodospirillaceae bacterium]
MKISVKSQLPSEWTTVPGWDSAKKEYVDLDCERWIHENGIREAGRKNGERNFPASDAAQPDDVYQKILDWVNRRGKACHLAVSEFLVQQRHALEMETKKGMAPIRHRVEGLRDEGILKLQEKGKRDRLETSPTHRAGRLWYLRSRKCPVGRTRVRTGKCLDQSLNAPRNRTGCQLYSIALSQQDIF